MVQLVGIVETFVHCSWLRAVLTWLCIVLADISKPIHDGLMHCTSMMQVYCGPECCSTHTWFNVNCSLLPQFAEPQTDC